MRTSDCPTAAERIDYLRTTLPPDRAEAIADHLGSCPACLAATEADAIAVTIGDVPGTVGPGPIPSAGIADTRPADPRPTRAGARAPAERGTLVGGRYLLLEPIGEGGMGSVFLAQQVEPVRRQVAVKLIKPGMDTGQVLARFDAERQALAMMDHPNIARVLDAGASANGRPFFAMELVQGVPITQFSDEERLTVAERLGLFLPVCRAVQHAHQKGVIHRDLKPSNILVARYDGRPVPKVIDFGVAKAAGQPLTDKTLMTRQGAVVGTLQYMAPEQAGADERDVDTRADVYALGVVLYELLTGTTPLERGRMGKTSLLDLLRVIREEEPPRPSARLAAADGLPAVAAARGTEPRRLSATVRGELDWIVMKALEKDRARRYETASGLARDVERFLADEPVEAGPPSARYRLGKLARRNKGAIRAAAGFLILLLAATAVSSWQAVRATRAEGLERAQRLRSESRYALAREAVEALYKGASEDVLLKEPLLKDLRARLLGAALEFHRKLQAERRDEGGGAAELADGYEQVARLSAEIGSKREALDGYERALALRRGLADSAPDDPGPRRDLARVLAGIAEVRFALDPPEVSAAWSRLALAVHESVARMTGAVEDRLDAAADQVAIARALAETKQAEQGLAAYGRAEQSLRRIAEADPTDPRPRRDLALALLGDGLCRQNNLSMPAESIAALRESVGLLEALAVEPGAGAADIHLRLDWARALHWLGVAHHQAGTKDDSLDFYRRSLEVIGPVAARYPTLLAVRRSIADTRMAIGITLADLGSHREALAEDRKALPIFEGLVDENRAVPIYRRRLASCLTTIAIALDSLGDLPAAGRHFERAIALSERLVEDDPTTLIYQTLLAENHGHFGGHHRRAGRRDLARASYRRALEILAPLPAGNVFERYNRGCFYAQAADLAALDPDRPTPAERSEGRVMADRAMDCLRDALEHGYRSVDWIDKDTDLDVLRGRDDFGLLRLDMMFPADPFAR